MHPSPDRDGAAGRPEGLKDELAIARRESERLYERLQFWQVRVQRLSPVREA